MYLECYTFEYIKILDAVGKNKMRRFAKGNLILEWLNTMGLIFRAMDLF